MQRLITLLRNNFNHERQLGQIQHSCCAADATVVFDFDRIKEDFCRVIGIPDMKSVDALFFTPSGRVLFIEMKRYTPTPPANATRPHLTPRDYIEMHLQMHEFPHKIVDSVFLILAMCGYYQIDSVFYGYILNPNPNTKFVPVLLIDLSDREYVNHMQSNIASRNISFTKRVESPIKIFNCRYFTQFLQVA